jgi:hypothetical protein
MPRAIKPDLYTRDGPVRKDPLWQKRVYKRDDAGEFNKTLRMLSALFTLKKQYPPHTDMRFARSSSQRCMMKLRYGDDKQTHVTFIKEYLPQVHKKNVEQKPALFSDGDVNEAFIENYMKTMSKRHFKFIISPESQRVDLEALVKTLVKRMEAATGYSFKWMAAVHTDTGHNHAHLLIDGRDKHRKRVRFDKTFIKQTMREMTGRICTSMIGKRSSEEIANTVKNLYHSRRYCELDDALSRRSMPSAHPDYEGTVRTASEELLKRLNFLSELRIARRDDQDTHTFHLTRNWKETLRISGRYNSFLSARNGALANQGHILELCTADTGPVEGTVTKLYKMNDEDNWNHALVITNESKSYYLPLYYEPDDALLHKKITCAFKKNQKGLLVPVITAEKQIPGPAQKNILK